MAGQSLITLNAGSSSVKFAIFASEGGDPEAVYRGQVAGIARDGRFEVVQADGGSVIDEALDAPDHAAAIARILDWVETAPGLPPLAAAGHRVVHGGMAFTEPVIVNAANLEQFAELEPLAPHHQPHNVAAIRAVAQRLPALPQVACFDTEFHARQPEVARQTGLPHRYWERGIRRYGFHGISYEAIVGRFPEVTGKPLPEKLVVAHLGNGASMCAVQQGRSIATTMGFSTIDGIPMGTRSGAIDPGALVYVARDEHLSIEQLADLLYDRSGLLGISEVAPEMHRLLSSDAPGAREAIDFFCYRINRELGSLAAALGGLDALVFTGGIGENAAPVRDTVCRHAAWLGIELDEAANEQGGPMISTETSPAGVWVIPTDEEGVIAGHTLRLIGAG